MKKLKVDYLDLCILHQPFGDVYGAYRALEDLYDHGKIRAIGISNFYADSMVDIASFARVRPMVNQIEVHPHCQQEESKIWHDKYGVQVEAWAPFGEGRVRYVPAIRASSYRQKIWKICCTNHSALAPAAWHCGYS